jgi:superoxide dismutase, Fe-Mn family
MTYSLPELSYDPGALEPHLSAAIIELHHDKHHAAYVKGANDTLEKLAAAREKGDFAPVVGLQKSLAFNLSGHVLHTLYWANLSPEGGDKPSGAFADAVAEDFGSFDAFKAHFTSVAETTQGSGWALLSYDPLGAKLLVHQVEQHHYNVTPGAVPLLAVDVWEHAFYLQYENRKPEYVKAIWNVINWADVAARWEQARA